MRIEIHVSKDQTLAHIICETEEEADALYNIAPIGCTLEAVIEHSPGYKWPHIIIKTPEVEP